jgi:hypothetical protein
VCVIAGATPLVLAALAKGVRRVKVIIKHGKQQQQQQQQQQGLEVTGCGLQSMHQWTTTDFGMMPTNAASSALGRLCDQAYS